MPKNCIKIKMKNNVIYEASWFDQQFIINSETWLLRRFLVLAPIWKITVIDAGAVLESQNLNGQTIVYPLFWICFSQLIIFNLVFNPSR